MTGTRAEGADGEPPAWLPSVGDERVRWRGGPRVQTVIPAAAIGLALVVAGAVLAAGVLPFGLGLSPLVRDVVAGLFVAVGVAMPLYASLDVRNTDYVVTDRGVYRKDGVLSRSVTAVGFETIQNVGYAQGVTGTLFDYGTLGFETAGSQGTEVSFADVNDPRSIERLVSEHLGSARGRDDPDGGIPGTAEQWEAVLAEVRAIGRALASPGDGRRE